MDFVMLIILQQFLLPFDKKDLLIELGLLELLLMNN